MEKIRFDVSKKADILSGKYRVVTRDNRPLLIIALDRKGVFSNIGLNLLEYDELELLCEFRPDGTSLYNRKEYKNDLFLIEN